jgi:hypothetical protein
MEIGILLINNHAALSIEECVLNEKKRLDNPFPFVGLSRCYLFK